MEEIGAEENLHPFLIAKEEFEVIWEKARAEEKLLPVKCLLSVARGVYQLSMQFICTSSC